MPEPCARQPLRKKNRAANAAADIDKPRFYRQSPMRKLNLLSAATPALAPGAVSRVLCFHRALACQRSGPAGADAGTGARTRDGTGDGTDKALQDAAG